jgi:hypothetical protein
MVMADKNISTGCFKKTQIYLHLNPWSVRFTGKENTKPSFVFETGENI